MPTDALRRTIIEDLAAGEELLSLSRAVRLPMLCVNGRPHQVSWIHRAAMSGCRGADGRRIILETTVLSGRRVTTKSAVLRFIERQGVAAPIAGGCGAPPLVSSTHHRATAALAKVGI